MTPLSVLRYAISVVYLGMAAYLILAGARRLVLVAMGEQPADPGPYAALGIGVCAIGLLIAYGILRRRGTQKRLR